MSLWKQVPAFLSSYLEQNSIVTYHSAIPDHHREEMKRMVKRMNRVRAKEVKESLKNDESKVEAFRAFRKPGLSESKLITVADVNGELEKLFQLSLSGPALKEWKDTVESEAILEEIKARAQEEVPHMADGS
jgi:hypothetical protein